MSKSASSALTKPPQVNQNANAVQIKVVINIHSSCLSELITQMG